ncbi:hypothetical protein XE97_25145 [Salmonella enterica subsp. enterica serovar Senftenberg]|nr:hypothetical protein [Salmonella enterica subsp. enterica serovar Senftenberg]
MTIKTLLDIADTVQDALSRDPQHGPLIRAMQAVANQTFAAGTPDEVDAAAADADRTSRALAELLESVAMEVDLHNETDAGTNWVLVPVARFDPRTVYPGAVVWVSDAGTVLTVRVLKTELLDQDQDQDRNGSAVRGVLVTFRPTAGTSS